MDSPSFEDRSEQSVSIDVPDLDPVEQFSCKGCGASVSTSGRRAFSTVACPSCGTDGTIPAKFGHFLLLDRLGAGGMGTVFMAEDTTLGRKVAIKMMQKALAADSSSFEVFRNEAQSAAKLNHPHVAQVYSFGQQNGCPFLEMELVPGSSLDKLISERTQLDPAFVMRIGLEIAEGLKAAEGVGLFHGDIKPDNILFDANMHGKLVDFGIASLASQGKSNELWGTPYYIAPEKVQKKKNSARSDIYSLGATLYHAIAGQPPYEAEDAVAVIKARFKGPPRPLEEIRPDIEPEVARIIGRMVYNDLFMRYPNYGSLINDIKNYLSSVPAIRKQGPLLPQHLAARTLTTGLSPVDLSAGETGRGRPVKKLIIQKGSSDTSPPLAVMPSAKVFHVPKQDKPLAPESEENSTNGAKVTLIAIGSLILLGLVGGAAWLGSILLSNLNSAKRSEQTSADAQVLESKYYETVDEIGATLNRMRARDTDMTTLLASISSIFVQATDVQMTLPDLEPPPVEIAPVVVAETTSVVAANEATKGDKADSIKFDPEWELKARIELTKQKIDSPPPEVIALMIKQLKEKEATSVTTPQPEPEPTPVPEPESEAVALQPNQASFDQLQALADRLVFNHAKSIRAALRRCETIAFEESEVFPEIKPSLSPVQIETAFNRRRTAYEKRAKDLAEMNALITAAEESLKNIKRSAIQIESTAQRAIQERADLARANQAAEEQAKQQAEQAAEDARAQAIADDEISRVRSVLAGKQNLIKAFDYARVVREMQRMERELTTQPGKDELAWTLERFNRLESLQKFLIDDIKKNGRVLRGYQNYDVRGLSPDGLELLIPPRPNVAINTLTVGDWLALIRGQLEMRPYDRPIGTVEWGDQLFNAAIFCYTHGDGNEYALKLSTTLRAQALTKKKSLQFDADKLLPLPTSAESGDEDDADGFGF